MSGLAGIIGARVAHPDAASQVDAMGRLLERGTAETVLNGSQRNERLAAHVAWARRGYEAEAVGWNARRDICLIFTGEDFDLPEKIPSLAASIEPGSTAAEYLVRLYEVQGADFASTLNGRFSGVILDLRSETVVLFNDRYGLNRIYYHVSAEGFVFSSEAKSILATLPHLREIDQQGLAEYFRVGCVLQNRSLFKGIALLPPGSWWTFERNGVIRKRQYFDARTWENQEALSSSDYTERLIEVFGRIAPKYISGEAPVGMSLTGGLDSRMILAWVRAAPGRLPCYTFGGPYRDCADLQIARQLAAICEQPHTTIQIRPDFFKRFTALAEKTIYTTDGTMDVSGAVELYVNEHARKIAPVRVTGNYGSEILRSNVAFRPRPVDPSLFTAEFQQLLAGAAETYRAEAVGHRLSFIAFKQVPWHHHSRFAAERSQLTPRSPFLDNELVALAYRAPPALSESPGPILQLITKGNSELDTVATDRALRQRTVPILSKIEHSWQEFTAKAEYAYDYGMPTWLTRADRAFKPLHLEKLFLGRHKFYHFRIWYRDQLSHALQHEFDFSDQPSCYVPGTAQRLIEEHTSGAFNHTLELHKLLSARLIERLFTGPTCSR